MAIVVIDGLLTTGEPQKRSEWRLRWTFEMADVGFHKQAPTPAMLEVSFAPSINEETGPVLDLLFHGCGFSKLAELKSGTAQGNVALAVAPESPFNGR